LDNTFFEPTVLTDMTTDMVDLWPGGLFVDVIAGAQLRGVYA
jgi:hypothetical protein